VLGCDVTPEMLAVATTAGRGADGQLLLADAGALPLRDGTLDAVFAAGLLSHFVDRAAAVTELARVTRPGGLLVVFHPIGRAALAARHGHEVRPDDPLSAVPLNALLDATGWFLTTYDDAPHRFLALAERH
jgi:ubiquinone/menaquinone biosynthesis C-methylase UbiE